MIFFVIFVPGGITAEIGICSSHEQMPNAFRMCFQKIADAKSKSLKFLSQSKALGFYQMMKVVDELFNAYDIAYWAITGTLLGAVRNHGLIPWDYNMDIAIFGDDIEKLKTLEPLFGK